MTTAVQEPCAKVRALRVALYDYVDASPRAAAIGLQHLPLRDAYHAKDNWDHFASADVEPCRLRYILHRDEGEPFGAAELLIGIVPAESTPDEPKRDEALEALKRAAPAYARVEAHGKRGVRVGLPTPLMTPRGGFEPHTAELALRWFRILADWWNRDGAVLFPDAVQPTTGGPAP